MCIEPCQTCSELNFYSCLTCPDDTYTLVSEKLCVIHPNYVFMLATTCMLVLFFIPVALRKRGIVLIRILDYVQMAALFKLVKGHTSMRTYWLYLGMRGWGDWEQGWTFIEGDKTVPIWINDQGVINKSIRIGCTWGVFLGFYILLGIIRNAFDERKMSFKKYMVKNIGNLISISFYFTLQDASFIVATVVFNYSFGSLYEIISFSIAVILVILMFAYIIWCFSVINFPNSFKYHHYQYLFLFALDYDMFPTYSLLDLPKTSKQIRKYSNLRILDMMKKIGYSFLIAAYLNSEAYQYATADDQLIQIAAYIAFFEIIFLIIMPFDLKNQIPQFVILILALTLTFFILFAPWSIDVSLIHLIAVLGLFGLAFLCVVVQYCFKTYQLIPVDLYEIGLKVVVEDAGLIKQMAQRKREQEEMERKLRQLEEQKMMMEKKLKEKADRQILPVEEPINEVQKPKIKTNDPSRKSIESVKKPQVTPISSKKRLSSQKQMPNNEKTKKSFEKMSQQIDEQNNEDQRRQDSETSLHNVKTPSNHNSRDISDALEENQSMNSEQVADLYKIDELKRRKVYQWNRQQPFQFSNKMQ